MGTNGSMIPMDFIHLGKAFLYVVTRQEFDC